MHRAGELAGTASSSSDCPGQLAGGFEEIELAVLRRKDGDSSVHQPGKAAYAPDGAERAVFGTGAAEVVRNETPTGPPQNERGLRIEAPELSPRMLWNLVDDDLNSRRVPHREGGIGGSVRGCRVRFRRRAIAGGDRHNGQKEHSGGQGDRRRRSAATEAGPRGVPQGSGVGTATRRGPLRIRSSASSAARISPGGTGMVLAVAPGAHSRMKSMRPASETYST